LFIVAIILFSYFLYVIHISVVYAVISNLAAQRITTAIVGTGGYADSIEKPTLNGKAGILLIFDPQLGIPTG
jgi:hypothetical protein